MTTRLNDFSGIDESRLPRNVVRRARPRGALYRNHAKRVLDVLFVVLMAPVALPLLFVACLLASLDGGPVFYKQRRIGRHGRVFRLLKIRTMVPNAEALLQQHLEDDAEARAEWECTQKLKRDPRITPIGRFLRKSSLDELPQLWNVLKGDMSLIGPRPMMVCQQDLYPGTAYYAMRPGITGSWQVSDRNESSFASRAQYDAEYYKSLSFATDLSILVRTIGVVVRGTGY